MRKFFACIFALFIAMTIMVVPHDTVAAAVEYQIYPKPQRIQYEDEALTLTSQVNLVVDSSIDAVTIQHLKNVLTQKGLTASVSNELSSTLTNVLVGTKDAPGSVIPNMLNTSGIVLDQSIFSNTDAYQLSIKNNAIAIIGKDSDASYYGITSLKHILNQSENSVRTLDIYDYSSSKWRGFIEGFYGIPWSFENRKSLMEFGSDFKMNAYIFAPKDDLYHNEKWRSLYPQEELNKLKELVDVGTATKTKFIWTLHPFDNMGIDEEVGEGIPGRDPGVDFSSEETYQRDLALIKTKFDQLYSIGVRQFGILADDIKGVTPQNQVKLMNDLKIWNDGKVGNYNLIFVPSLYCELFWDLAELFGMNQEYVQDIGLMDESIEIMWTGSTVCTNLVQSTIDFFHTQVSLKSGIQRDPFIWMNWPVNDYKQTHLLMGKGEVYDQNVSGFAGIVSNPMQQAQASKIGLFATADYAWNRNGFDVDQSWKDSFAYIESGADRELNELAKHLADPNMYDRGRDFNNGYGLSESEDLKPALDALVSNLAQKDQITNEIDVLIPEFESIIANTKAYKENATNVTLKNEIIPWVNSLEDISLTSIDFLNGTKAAKEKNLEEMIEYLNKGVTALERSRAHEVQNLHRVDNVISGDKHILPFAKSLRLQLAYDTTDLILTTEESSYTSVSITAMKTAYATSKQVHDNTESKEVDKENAIKDLIGKINELKRVNENTIGGIEESYTLTLGKSVTITPTPAVGEWAWDEAYLDAKLAKTASTSVLAVNGPITFSAKKIGTTAISYTSSGTTKTATIKVVGREEVKPNISTGDTTNVILLVGLMIATLGGITYTYHQNKKRKGGKVS